MKETKKENEDGVVEEFKVGIYKAPENQLSLQVNLGNVTMGDGTKYTISQSGMVISVSPENSMSPRLCANIGKVVTHMAGILHKDRMTVPNKKEPRE